MPINERERDLHRNWNLPCARQIHPACGAARVGRGRNGAAVWVRRRRWFRRSSLGSILANSTAAAPAPTPPTLDITPTVTFDANATTGLMVNNAFLTSTSAVNPAFTFNGAAPSLIAQLGSSVPRLNMVTVASSNADTFGPGTVYATFYHTGTMLDVAQFGLQRQRHGVHQRQLRRALRLRARVRHCAERRVEYHYILSASSSAISGFYNEYYIRIAGGTGVLNEVKQVTSYDGTTFIATVDSAWTTPPDSTTQYVIQEGTQPFVLDASTGLVKYLHFRWNVSGQRKITIEQGIFAGVASDGTIAPAPLAATVPFMAIGDSFWEGIAGPNNVANLIDIFAESLNWQTINLGQGGTGFIGASEARLNFQDRIAPPTEAWRVSLTGTGGTYTISVLINGVTNTTAALAFNTKQTDIQAALNALGNVAAAGGSFSVARNDISAPLILVGHGIAGATISVDGGQLSGGAITVLGTYLGDVAENVPTDSTGKALPFFLIVSGSGNDAVNSDAQVQAAASYVAQQIALRFPTASTIFIGVLGDCNANSNLIAASDVSRNAAIAAAAALLPPINGKLPFVDTYAAGVGAPKIINGLGTVANPQAGTNSNLKSITQPGHPTGAGAQFLANWLAPKVQAIVGTA